MLFDAQGQPVLVGFLSDDANTISVDSTVKASLYMGLGTVLLPAEVRQMFWEQVDTFPGYRELLADVVALMRSDAFFFRKDAYQQRFAAYLSTFRDGGVNARLVPEGNIKSGMQLKEAGGDSVVVVQNYRRRTHAFIYKLNFETVYVVAPLPEAVDYTITVIEQTPDARPSYVGGGTTWRQGDPTTDGVYMWETSFNAVSTPVPGAPEDWLAEQLPRQQGYDGTAKVVIRIPRS